MARPKPASGQLRSRSELITAARRRGRSGKTALDWIRNDPALLASYDQGRAEFADTMDRGPAAPHLPSNPPRGGAPAGGRDGSSSFGRASASAQNRAGGIVSRQISAAGDGGGLLLAFVLYPIGLAILKHGAAGPGLWFRAKWLNETAASPDNLSPTQPPNIATPSPKDNVPGMPGYRTNPSQPYDPKAKPGPDPFPRNPDGSFKMPPRTTV